MSAADVFDFFEWVRGRRSRGLRGAADIVGDGMVNSSIAGGRICRDEETGLTAAGGKRSIAREDDAPGEKQSSADDDDESTAAEKLGSDDEDESTAEGVVDE